MTDQLSLRLEARLPNLPEGLRPMLARPLAEPFDSANHFFEPSWGGRRALALIGPAARAGSGDVRFLDEDGLPLSPTLPELAGLAARLDARSAVLDGELVVVDAAGRADPAELERRLAGRRGRPAAYLAFDLLHLDGRSLLGQPLARRRDLLRRVLHAGDEVVAVPAILREGRALHAAVVEQGLAGIVARVRSSPYLPGTRSRLWRYVSAQPEPLAAGVPNTELGLETEEPGPGSGPVLALISRLPLDLEDRPD
jgi:bifunctional non-homologous end joining protein LigD